MTEPTTPDPIPAAESSSPSWFTLALAGGALVLGTVLLVVVRRASSSTPAGTLPPPDLAALAPDVQGVFQYFSDAWEQRFVMLADDNGRLRTEIGALRAAIAGGAAQPMQANAAPMAPQPTTGAAPLAAVSLGPRLPDPVPQDPQAAQPAGPVQMLTTRAAVSF